MPHGGLERRRAKVQGQVEVGTAAVNEIENCNDERREQGVIASEVCGRIVAAKFRFEAIVGRGQAEPA